MNLVVAVHALAGQNLRDGAVGRYPGSAVRRTGMIPCVMALLTQPGFAPTQQWRVVRAVRRVAVAAVFAYRLMFPQERTALFRVALETGLVDRVVNQAGVSGRTVGIMAVRAGHQADVGAGFGSGLHRVPRLAHELRTLFCMAVVTDGGLALERQYRVVFDMYFMTVDTGGFLDVMHAPHPVEAAAVIVAAEANGILFIRRHALAERDRRGWPCTVRRFPGMGLARAVAGFTIMVSIGEG